MVNTATTNRQEELNAIVANEYMLTTIDNPFNPFTQYSEWYAYDLKLGHNTCAYIARIVKSSNELSEADEALAINQAIDEILEFNLTGKHVKVTKDNFNKIISRDK